MHAAHHHATGMPSFPVQHRSVKTPAIEIRRDEARHPVGLTDLIYNLGVAHQAAALF
jgi:hypothetical protein